jgi:membrane protease YdiL (CAAX protease family)
MYSYSIRSRTFFTLTYILSWLIWIPLDMSHFGIGPFHISEGISTLVRLLGVLMPAVSALILTSRAGGQDAVRTLLGRLAIWRVDWIWWVVAVLVQPVMLGVTGLLFNGLGGQPPISPVVLTSVAGLIVNIIFLAIATLGEEIGWRGVALPSLQSERNTIQASLILGFLWAAWHIPFWLLLDTFDQFGWTYLGLNFIFVLLGTFYITWFFNHSRSSLLLPVAFHLSFNIFNTALFPVTTSPEAFAIFIAIEFVITLLIVRHLEPPLAQT